MLVVVEIGVVLTGGDDDAVGAFLGPFALANVVPEGRELVFTHPRAAGLDHGDVGLDADPAGPAQKLDLGRRFDHAQFPDERGEVADLQRGIPLPEDPDELELPGQAAVPRIESHAALEVRELLGADLAIELLRLERGIEDLGSAGQRGQDGGEALEGRHPVKAGEFAGILDQIGADPFLAGLVFGRGQEKRGGLGGAVEKKGGVGELDPGQIVEIVGLGRGVVIPRRLGPPNDGHAVRDLFQEAGPAGGIFGLVEAQTGGGQARS